MGFVLLGVVIAAISFAMWALVFPDRYFLWFIPAPEVSNWGVLIAALVAMIGWLVTSIITTRNSVKQYTITMLLQTRLSTEYIKHSTIVNNLLFNDSDLKITIDFMRNDATPEQEIAISYVLNYVEFVSAGLRCGDFDNQLLKMTLKGIFRNLYARCEPYITESQKQNPQCLIHFQHVCKYWAQDK